MSTHTQPRLTIQNSNRQVRINTNRGAEANFYKHRVNNIRASKESVNEEATSLSNSEVNTCSQERVKITP